jgi:toxin ParE2
MVRFLEIAEIELDQAIHWYRTQAPGLDDAFLIEVLSAADRIAQFPEAWHPLGGRCSALPSQRFPTSWCWRSRTCIAGRTIGGIG